MDERIHLNKYTNEEGSVRDQWRDTDTERG